MTLQWWQALLLGALQGSTELFPVSSLGHAVLLPGFLHWDYKPSDLTFVPFLVLLHLGTAGALLVLYRHDWARIAAGFARAAVRGSIQGQDERLAMLLVVGTVPTGLIGVLFQSQLKSLFGSPRTAASFLLVNGLLLIGAEVLRRRDERRSGQAMASGEERESVYGEVPGLSFRVAAMIGACQALALFPGISRSGVTMAGGLLGGLRHQEAARFSFLLATPIIGAAGVLEVPGLIGTGAPLLQYTVAALVAGLAAYASARFLLRYFRSGRLDPYGVYCIAIGALALILIH